jgi:Xaa-Pro aminopeptidase
MTGRIVRNSGRVQLANVDRLHRLMDRDGLAALVLRAGENVTYLAGFAYPGTLGRHLDLAGSRRGVLLVWPREGEPRLIVDAIAAGVTERDSAIARLDVFNGYQENAYQRLCRVLKELRLERSRVGFDKNSVGAQFWEGLVTELPQMHTIDCTRLMDEARWIKTPGEIDLLREGATLLDKVYLEVFPTIRPGESERDVHCRIVAGCIRAGAGFAHGILNSHRNPVIYCGESDFVFQSGDIVRTDYVAYLRGYPGHQSRNAVLGAPSAEQLRDYSIYREVYALTFARCRPGTTAGEVYDHTAAEFKKRGWTYKPALVGHSIGPWWHQQEPIFCRDNNTPLEPGMVVAIEPFVDHWHVQDLVLVTEAGPELLSPDFPTQELFVVQ